LSKEHAWKLLVDRGLVEDKKAAVSWIMMGKVLADGQRVDKAGELLSSNATLKVKGLDQKYESRGGLKLEGAIEDFDIEVEDRVAIDCGASTGGFTDCLLQYGAKRVYAVDVGYGQLTGKLRANSRVINMERTNISDVDPTELVPPPTLATVDLSYLSLRKALPIVKRLLVEAGQTEIGKENGEMVCLVKPLFEVEDPQTPRRGRIEEPAIFVEVLEGLVKFAREMGLQGLDITDSPIVGGKGTREFFLRAFLEEVHEEHEPKRVKERIEKAVERIFKSDRPRPD